MVPQFLIACKVVQQKVTVMLCASEMREMMDVKMHVSVNWVLVYVICDGLDSESHSLLQEVHQRCLLCELACHL